MFLIDIKRLVRDCEYGDRENEMLRDQIVMGVCDKKLQSKLLEMVNLTYENAVDKARASEVTKEQASTMSKNAIAINEIRHGLENTHYTQYRSKNQTAERNNNSNDHRRNTPRGPWNTQRADNNNTSNRARDIGSRTNNQNENVCNRCTYTHRAGACPAYGKMCNKCSKPNHFSKACKTKTVSAIEFEDDNEYNNNDNFDDNNDNDEFYIGSVEREVNETETDDANFDGTPWIEHVRVSNINVPFKVDTGAEIDVLPLGVCVKLGVQNVLEPTTITLRAFGGNKIKPNGMCSLICKYKNVSLRVRFAVVDLDVAPILGLSTSRRLKIVTTPKKRNI